MFLLLSIHPSHFILQLYQDEVFKQMSYHRHVVVPVSSVAGETSERLHTKVVAGG